MSTVKLNYTILIGLGLVLAIAYGAKQQPKPDEYFDEVTKAIEKRTGHKLKDLTKDEAIAFVFYIVGNAWYDGNDAEGTLVNLKKYLEKHHVCSANSNLCHQTDKAAEQHKLAAAQTKNKKILVEV